MVRFGFHICKFLLHLLKFQNLFPLLNHYILLSLDHIVFPSQFFFESLILGIKCLLDNLDGRSSWGLPDMSIAHGRSLLNVGRLLWEDSFLLIGQAGRNIGLIEHLLESALGLSSVVFNPLLHLDLGCQGLPLHTLYKIFLGLFSNFLDGFG